MSREKGPGAGSLLPGPWRLLQGKSRHRIPLAVPQLNITRSGRAAYWTEVQPRCTLKDRKVLERTAKLAVVMNISEHH